MMQKISRLLRSRMPLVLGNMPEQCTRVQPALYKPAGNNHFQLQYMQARNKTMQLDIREVCPTSLLILARLKQD